MCAWHFEHGERFLSVDDTVKTCGDTQHALRPSIKLCSGELELNDDHVQPTPPV